MISWVDIESSGLDPDHHLLLEVGLTVTDNKLRVIGQFMTVIQEEPARVRERISSNEGEQAQLVMNMHTANGLLTEVEKGTPMALAERTCCDFLSSLDALGLPMAGSTPQFDRRFLFRYMPKLESMFHYRSLDVSSFKELAKLWRPDIMDHLPKPQKRHRALPDIEDSIAELAFYRDHFVRVIQ